MPSARSIATMENAHCIFFFPRGSCDVYLQTGLSAISTRSFELLCRYGEHKTYLKLIIWVRSRNCGCLVTWFCYQLIAKPGNKTAAFSWPDPYTVGCCHNTVHRNNMILCTALQWARHYIKLEYVLTKGTPYLALTGELQGVYCEDF